MSVGKTITIAALLFSAGALPALADRYSASTSPALVAGSPCSGIPNSSNSASPVSAAIFCGSADGSKSAAARAGAGAVHAQAQASGFSNGASGEARFDGMVNFTSATLNSGQVQFVIPLSGFMVNDLGILTPGDPFGANVVTSVDALLSVSDPFGSQFSWSFSEAFKTDANGTRDISVGINTLTAVGAAGLGVIDLKLISPAMLLPFNTDLRFTLLLNAGASSFASHGGATSDFSHTFGFKVGETPFILPQGVIANAGDYIVNGVVVGSDVPPAGVPEPGAWAFILLGFGGVGALARSRRRLRSIELAVLDL